MNLIRKSNDEIHLKSKLATKNKEKPFRFLTNPILTKFVLSKRLDTKLVLFFFFFFFASRSIKPQKERPIFSHLGLKLGPKRTFIFPFRYSTAKEHGGT